MTPYTEETTETGASPDPYKTMAYKVGLGAMERPFAHHIVAMLHDTPMMTKTEALTADGIGDRRQKFLTINHLIEAGYIEAMIPEERYVAATLRLTPLGEEAAKATAIIRAALEVHQ